MLISLSESEPFSQYPADPQVFYKFMRHMNPKQTYTFEGSVKPKSILILSIIYAYPHLSLADGYLLSIEVDPFLYLCRSGLYKTMQPLGEKYIIGKIHIEHGGEVGTTPLIKTEPYTLPRED